jgi:hypothetical protein
LFFQPRAHCAQQRLAATSFHSQLAVVARQRIGRQVGERVLCGIGQQNRVAAEDAGDRVLAFGGQQRLNSVQQRRMCAQLCA